jgi:hypothetical protein
MIAGYRPRLADAIHRVYKVTRDLAEKQVRNFEARDPFSRTVSQR